MLANFSWETSATEAAAGVRVLLGSAGSGELISFSLAETSESFMPSTNLPGGDVKGDDFSLNASVQWTDRTGAAACARFCDGHDECTGWTYVRPGSFVDADEAQQGVEASAGGPRCAIKGAQQTAPPQASGCCVSGYKPGHAPAPVPNRTEVTVSGGGHAMVGHLAEGAGRREMRLRILVDHSVVEVYDGVGALTFTTYVPAPERATGIQLEWVEGADVQASLRAYAMGGAVL